MNSRRDVLEMPTIFDGSMICQNLGHKHGRDDDAHSYSLMTIEAGFFAWALLESPGFTELSFRPVSPVE